VAFSPASFSGLHSHFVGLLPCCSDVVVFVFTVRVCHQSDVTNCITSCTGSWGCPCLLFESIQEVFYLATIELILCIDCSCPLAFWLGFTLAPCWPLVSPRHMQCTTLQHNTPQHNTPQHNTTHSTPLYTCVHAHTHAPLFSSPCRNDLWSRWRGCGLVGGTFKTYGQAPAPEEPAHISDQGWTEKSVWALVPALDS